MGDFVTQAVEEGRVGVEGGDGPGDGDGAGDVAADAEATGSRVPGELPAGGCENPVFRYLNGGEVGEGCPAQGFFVGELWDT